MFVDTQHNFHLSSPSRVTEAFTYRCTATPKRKNSCIEMVSMNLLREKKGANASMAFYHQDEPSFALLLEQS